MMTRFLKRTRTAFLRIRHSHIPWPQKFDVGTGVHIAVTDGATWSVGEHLALADLAHVFVKCGTLKTGRNVHIGIGSVVACRDRITIGDDVLIAEHVTIRDQDHRYGGPLPAAQNGFETAPITIGNNVWIAAKVTITKGVTIGDNVTIGANSVVTRDIPSNCVAFGAPAKVHRQNGQAE